jgi:hypothetical protein
MLLLLRSDVVAAQLFEGDFCVGRNVVAFEIAVAVVVRVVAANLKKYKQTAIFLIFKSSHFQNFAFILNINLPTRKRGF